MGHPMSHSTHSGFNGPPGGSLPFGHSTIVKRHGEFRFSRFLTHVASPSPLVGLAPFLLWFPQTVGVGALLETHDPDSIAVVDERDLSAMSREGGFICSEHTPSSIEPHLGQVSKNCSKPSSNESWGVLHEDVSGSNLANDPSKFAPET